MKVHTCSRHIQCDREKKQNSLDLGPLYIYIRHELYSSFRLLVIGNKSTYVVNMGWERVLLLRICNKIQNLKRSCDFFIRHCHINFQTCENHPNITHVPHLCEIAQASGIRSVYSMLENLPRHWSE